jgi:gas vesicle protein
MNTGKLALGILAGAAAGALAGILFAPNKGSETRKQMFTKGEELAETAQKKIDETMNAATDTYNVSRDEVKKLVSEGKAQYNAVKQDGQGVHH